MAGKVGNPYHDPETGKFTSGEGLNRDNSTRGQRFRGHLKTAGKALGAAALAGAGYVAKEIAMSYVNGAKHVGKRHSAGMSDAFIKKYSPHVEKAAKTHGKAAVDSLTRWNVLPKKQAAAIKKTISSQSAKSTSGLAPRSGLAPKGKTTTLPGTFPYRKG